MKLLQYIVIVFLSFMPPVYADAQNAIDNVISSLEKSKSVTNEVFSERRDPSTRAVIKSNRLFNFSNDKLAEKIIEAMRKERSKAVEFQMNTRQGLTLYTISFDANGLCSKYTLLQKEGKDWIMSIEKTKRGVTRNGKSSRKDKRDRSDMLLPDDFGVVLDELLGCDDFSHDYIRGCRLPGW